MDTCDCCGSEALVKGTSFVGEYCIDCHRLVVAESRDAISTLRGRSGSRKRRGGVPSRTLRDALDVLLEGPNYTGR